MSVSEEQERVLGPKDRLSSLNGEGTRSEALAWLADQLRWEQRLARLEQGAPVAHLVVNPPARVQSPDAAQAVQLGPPRRTFSPPCTPGTPGGPPPPRRGFPASV